MTDRGDEGATRPFEKLVGTIVAAENPKHPSTAFDLDGVDNVAEVEVPVGKKQVCNKLKALESVRVATWLNRRSLNWLRSLLFFWTKERLR